MLRISTSILSLLVIASQAISQDLYRISGKVVDENTNEPLSFSTINISGTSEGVVSNFEGAFEFAFQDKYKNDSLQVSMLGYKPVSIAINSLLPDSQIVIVMEESIVMLEEVEVSEKKLTAVDIVNKVIENIPNNYPNAPYLLEGFTRSHKHECGRYVTLYEAAFELYGRGYQKKVPEKIYIKESRQSQHTPYYHSRVLRNNRNLFISMNHINDVLFRSFSLRVKNNRYAIDKYLVENDQLIYVIKTTHSKHVAHTMYINADDYALLKVRMELDTPKGEDWNPHLNKGASSDSLDFKVTRISKSIQFAKTGDRYFSKYMDWLVEGKLYMQETKEEFGDWGFRFENMFDKVTYGQFEKPSNDRLMNPRSKSDPPTMTYNEDFWNSYPLLKEFPVTPQIVTDLAVNGPIEEQFKQSSRK